MNIATWQEGGKYQNESEKQNPSYLLIILNMHLPITVSKARDSKNQKFLEVETLQNMKSKRRKRGSDDWIHIYEPKSTVPYKSNKPDDPLLDLHLQYAFSQGRSHRKQTNLSEREKIYLEKQLGTTESRKWPIWLTFNV